MRQYRLNKDLKKGEYIYRDRGFNEDLPYENMRIEKVKIVGNMVEVRIAHWKEHAYSPYLYGHKNATKLVGSLWSNDVAYINITELRKKHDIERDAVKYRKLNESLTKLQELGFTANLTKNEKKRW